MKNETLQNELINILGDRFSNSLSVRGNYSGGEDVFDPILSQAVVFPKNNEEISSIMKSCDRHKTPIVSFGTGTSLEGNALGNENGITLQGFLNCLDGFTCVEGTMLFLTANKPEVLDYAFIRSCRIDHKIELDYADKYQTKNMFLKILIISSS